MSRSAAPSSDVTMPIRRGSAGSGRLRAWSNKPSACEFLLELFERLLQRAEPLRLEVLADDLIFALRVVDADLAARHHLESVLGLELQVAHRRSEHHRLDLRRAVLEREIQVPGIPHPGVRDLTFDPHGLQLVLEQIANRGVQFADGQNGTRLAQRSGTAGCSLCGNRGLRPCEPRLGTRWNPWNLWRIVVVERQPAHARARRGGARR